MASETDQLWVTCCVQTVYNVTNTLLSSPSPLKVELKNDGTRKDKVPEE